MTSTDLQSIQPAELATIGTVSERLALAREFMATVMVEGIDGDYARIPGCGNKPSLLKPGAEKLARLFSLGIVREERTMLERLDDEGYVAAYRFSLAGPDGRIWGSAEAFAAEAEQTFARQKESGPALLNALTSRAQKRAFVRATIQAIGLSDLFSGDTAAASMLLTEAQRDIVVEIYKRTAPRNVDAVQRQATKVKQAAWLAFLGSAIDLASDVHGWDDKDRERATRALSDELADRDTVAELFGEVIVEPVEEAS